MRLLSEAQGRIVTTVLDYYGLPNDFPGMNTRPNGTALGRALHVERAIHRDLGESPNFLPFLALHEFEAWLFSSPDELPNTLTQPHKRGDFAAIRDAFEGPEEIDEGPETTPSKRIAQLFPGYRKVLHGSAAAKRIGIEAIRAAAHTSTRGIGSSNTSRPPEA